MSFIKKMVLIRDRIDANIERHVKDTYSKFRNMLKKSKLHKAVFIMFLLISLSILAPEPRRAVAPDVVTFDFFDPLIDALRGLFAWLAEETAKAIGGFFAWLITSILSGLGIERFMAETFTGQNDINLFGNVDTYSTHVHNVNVVYEWCVYTVFSILWVVLAIMLLMYVVSTLKEEWHAKLKLYLPRFVIAICLTPVIGYILKYFIVINGLACSSLINAFGVSPGKFFSDAIGEICSETGWTIVIPFIVFILVLGLVIMLYLRFALMLFTYAISPLAILFYGLPDFVPFFKEVGEKIIKVFFESTFLLFFYVVTFGIIAGIGDSFGSIASWQLMIAGLVLLISMPKIFFNPIGGAMSGAVTAGIGAAAMAAKAGTTAATGGAAGAAGMAGKAMGAAGGAGGGGGGMGGALGGALKQIGGGAMEGMKTGMKAGPAGAVMGPVAGGMGAIGGMGARLGAKGVAGGMKKGKEFGARHIQAGRAGKAAEKAAIGKGVAKPEAKAIGKATKARTLAEKKGQQGEVDFRQKHAGEGVRNMHEQGVYEKGKSVDAKVRSGQLDKKDLTPEQESHMKYFKGEVDKEELHPEKKALEDQAAAMGEHTKKDADFAYEESLDKSHYKDAVKAEKDLPNRIKEAEMSPGREAELLPELTFAERINVDRCNGAKPQFEERGWEKRIGRSQDKRNTLLGKPLERAEAATERAHAKLSETKAMKKAENARFKGEDKDLKKEVKDARRVEKGGAPRTASPREQTTQDRPASQSKTYSKEERDKLLSTKGLDKNSKEYQSKNVLKSAMSSGYHQEKRKNGATGFDQKAFDTVGKEYNNYLSALDKKDYDKVFEMMRQDKRMEPFMRDNIKSKKGGADSGQQQ